MVVEIPWYVFAIGLLATLLFFALLGLLSQRSDIHELNGALNAYRNRLARCRCGGTPNW